MLEGITQQWTETYLTGYGNVCDYEWTAQRAGSPIQDRGAAPALMRYRRSGCYPVSDVGAQPWQPETAAKRPHGIPPQWMTPNNAQQTTSASARR